MTKKKPFKRFSCLGFIAVALGCIGLTLVASSISSLSAPGVPPTATPKKGLSTILKVSPIGTQPATAAPVATGVPMIINTAAPFVTATITPGAAAAPVQAAPVAPVVTGAQCDPAYPDFCIAPAPPDLDCKDIPQKRFKVLPPDPHGFDKDGNGVGCES